MIEMILDEAKDDGKDFGWTRDDEKILDGPERMKKVQGGTDNAMILERLDNEIANVVS